MQNPIVQHVAWALAGMLVMYVVASFVLHAGYCRECGGCGEHRPWCKQGHEE